MKSPAFASLRVVKGLSLIELMVSLAIGLIVILATMATYLGSANTARIAEAQGRMNEDANAALAILSQHLRMAGNNPKQAALILATPACPRNPLYAVGVVNKSAEDVCGTGNYIVRGCDGKFSNITTATDIASLTCAAASAPSPHSIAVSYEADQYNTLGIPVTPATVPPTFKPTDCVGNSIPKDSAVGYYVADNRFYVGTSASITAPSLYCKGNGGGTQPLVENIEDLQFSYGVGAPGVVVPGNLAVVGYLGPAEVLTATGLAALAEADRWSRILTIRICVLVRSEGQVLDNPASARFIKCDGELEANPPDLRMRRAYSTTVVLRNRIN